MPKTKLGSIVVVDDDTEFLTPLCEILSGIGYEAVGFTSSKKALEVLKERSFELLMTDLLMPEMDGIAFLQEALKIDPLLVGIIMTGHATVQTALEAMKVGAFDYVTKPVEFRELTQTLSRAMEVRQLRMENVQLRESLKIYELTRALKESDEKYQALINNATDAIFIFDSDGNLLEVNKKAEQLTGYTKESLLKMKYTQLHPVDVINEINTAFMEGLETGSSSYVEMPLMRKDGMKVIVDLVCTFIDYKGKKLGQAIVRDITERKRTEEQLQLLKMAVESLEIGLTIADTGGRIIYTNPAEARMHGHTVEELIGREVQTFSPPELKRQMAFDQLWKEKTYMRESFNIRKDGTSFPVRLLSIGVRNDEGIPIGFITICEDITELKKVEKKLNATYKMTHDILEKSPYGIFVVNRGGAIDYVNPAMLKISGDTYEEFVGLSVNEIPPYINLGIAEKIVSTLEGETFFLGPVEFTSFYGQKMTIRNFIGIPLGESDERKALIFVEDITERKGVEEQNVRLAAAVESAAEAITITDVDGTILYVNPAFEFITGYSKEEAFGQTHRILASDKHYDAFYHPMLETIRRGEVWTGRVTSKRKDGTLYEEEATISPIRNSGDILNYVFVQRDVTEKIRLESIAEAVNTLNNIGYIFSGIRHEIGNPINSIKITLSVLRNNIEKYSKEMVMEYIDRLMTETVRVEYLLRSLKNFNMYESLNLQNIETASFIEKLLSLVEKDFEEKGISIKTIIHPDTELIYVDPRALHQVMLNILTNASDALEGREDPKIVINVFKMRGCVTISVADNGCGIPEDNQKNIFRPFYTSKASGTGLGLVIARKMLLGMNGTIEVMSQKDAGTIVDISVPKGNGGHA
jgi:PAS domain S-box-containing protein